MKNTQILCL